jgi:excisionase family DNA binding protein
VQIEVDELLTPGDAAALLGVSRARVRQLVLDGVLDTVMLGTVQPVRFVLRASAERYRAERGRRGRRRAGAAAAALPRTARALLARLRGNPRLAGELRLALAALERGEGRPAGPAGPGQDPA